MKNKATRLLVEEKHLIIILQNLIGNAIKYARPSSTIYVESDLTNNSFLFSITNLANCFASPTEEFSVFLKGYRGSNRGDEEGEGLGLHLARQTALHYGGDVKLDFTQEQDYCSFTFTLSLPRMGCVKERW